MNDTRKRKGSPSDGGEVDIPGAVELPVKRSTIESQAPKLDCAAAGFNTTNWPRVEVPARMPRSKELYHGRKRKAVSPMRAEERRGCETTLNSVEYFFDHWESIGDVLKPRVSELYQLNKQIEVEGVQLSALNKKRLLLRKNKEDTEKKRDQLLKEIKVMADDKIFNRLTAPHDA